MSVRAMKWAANLMGLSGKEKAVLFVLAEAHNGKTGKCCPSQETIGLRAGMNDKTTRKYLSLLESASLITRRVTSKGAGLITFYELHTHVLQPVKRGSTPNGTELPTGPNAANGIALPVGPAHANGTELPIGVEDQTVKTGGPNGNCLPFPIEEPEGTGRRDPSQDTNVSLEGRSADLFDLPSRDRHVDPTPTPKRSPSKPTSRNADPSSAEKDFIFKNGVQLLIAQGCTEQAARSFLGKLVRDWKTKPVAEAIKAAIFEKVGDAKSWIPAALKKRKSELSLKAAPTPETVGADDWAAAIRRWAEDGYWPSARLGLAPNQVGYRGPTKPLEDLLPSLGDHPAAREIRSTINLRASA